MSKKETKTVEKTEAVETATASPIAIEAALANFDAKTLNEKLKLANSAKADAFVKLSSDSGDYYQPKLKEVIKGMFIAATREGRNTIYGVARTAADGKSTETLKIKGAHSLGALRRAKSGQVVALTYLGEEKAEDGRINPKWDVGFYKEDNG